MTCQLVLKNQRSTVPACGVSHVSGRIPGRIEWSLLIEGIVRLIIVDDHLAFAEALALALAPTHDVVEILDNGDALLLWLADNEVQAVLLDTTLPHCNVHDTIRQIRRRYPSTLVVAMSIHDDHSDWPGLHRFGAHGVVSKTRNLYDLRVTLDILATRGSPLEDNQPEILHQSLTSRQMDVLVAIAADKIYKEIAEELDMSEARVDEHVAELKKRLKVRTSAGIVLRAVEEGWIEPRVVPVPQPTSPTRSSRY